MFNDFKFVWIKNFNDILDNCVFSNMFYLQNGSFHKWLVSSVKLRLVDKFMQTWNENVQTHNEMY